MCTVDARIATTAAWGTHDRVVGVGRARLQSVVIVVSVLAAAGVTNVGHKRLLPAPASVIRLLLFEGAWIDAVAAVAD